MKDEDRGHEEQAMIAKESIYLDSAASSHMTNKVDWLEDYEDIQGAVCCKLILKRGS